MALPPNIAGIARKNVNSAATVRETPMRSEPMMVAPEREVPGKIAAINWNTPIINAVRYPIAEMERTRGTCPRFRSSMIINKIPNRINMMATV